MGHLVRVMRGYPILKGQVLKSHARLGHLLTNLTILGQDYLYYIKLSELPMYTYKITYDYLYF